MYTRQIESSSIDENNRPRRHLDAVQLCTHSRRRLYPATTNV